MNTSTATVTSGGQIRASTAVGAATAQGEQRDNAGDRGVVA
jgi:hypothetical protein